MVNPQIRDRHIPEIAREVHSDRTVLPPSQEVQTQARVHIIRIHGQGARDQHTHNITQKESDGPGLSLNSAPGPWARWEVPGEAHQGH